MSKHETSARFPAEPVGLSGRRYKSERPYGMGTFQKERPFFPSSDDKVLNARRAVRSMPLPHGMQREFGWDVQFRDSNGDKQEVFLMEQFLDGERSISAPDGESYYARAFRLGEEIVIGLLREGEEFPKNLEKWFEEEFLPSSRFLPIEG